MSAHEDPGDECTCEGCRAEPLLQAYWDWREKFSLTLVPQTIERLSQEARLYIILATRD